ncbi:MAG: ABC transporter substrate-binding protein [Spirochaetes bacterium]|nr:ABC transporter substrate-binding protein [Spirochaetota bacterium]
MKIKTIMILIICHLFLILSCKKDQENVISQKSQSKEITVVDILGRKVTVTKSVERIAFVHPGSAVGLKILDSWDKTVLKHGSLNDEVLFPGVNSIPSVVSHMGNPYEPNYEILLNSDVDLLIAEVIPMPGMDEMLTKLEGIIPVFTAKLYEPDNITKGMKGLGQLLGKEKEAEEYISWYSEINNRLLEKTGSLEDHQKPKIFFKHGYGAAEDIMTFTDELPYAPYRNQITGCINVAADIPSQGGWAPNIDAEWLSAQQIDYIIIGDPMPAGTFGITAKNPTIIDNHQQAVSKLPVFSHSTAVQKNQIYSIGDHLFGSPTFIIGFVYMAKWFHPNLFPDLNPRQIHQEYLNRFMKININLEQQGLFVYP